MQLRPLLLAIPLFVAPFLGSAAEPAAPATPPPAAKSHDDHDHTPLEDEMSAMRGAFNKLRKQISDPASNASSLQLVAKLIAASEKSIPLEPARAAEVPESERAKFVAAYQEAMRDFVVEAKKLEAALQAGDNAKAAEILKDLGARQKDGHKRYRVQKVD